MALAPDNSPDAAFDTDVLTGLPTARMWPHLVADHQRSHPGRSWVVLMRVDEFSGFAAVHGEMAGDLLLAQTAEAWSAVLRAGDVLVRLGGGDFGCLVRACELTSAFSVVGRLRMALAAGVSCSAAITQPLAGESALDATTRLREGISEAGVRGASRIAVLLPPARAAA